MAFVETLQANPKISIIIIAAIISFFSMLITKYATDQKKMKELKERQKHLQKQMKEHKGNQKKVMELQKEIMNISMGMMKHSFRPLIITLVPLLIIFGFIRGVFTDVLSGWIWWYIISAVIFSSLLRKIMKVY